MWEAYKQTNYEINNNGKKKLSKTIIAPLSNSFPPVGRIGVKTAIRKESKTQ